MDKELYVFGVTKPMNVGAYLSYFLFFLDTDTLCDRPTKNFTDIPDAVTRDLLPLLTCDRCDVLRTQLLVRRLLSSSWLMIGCLRRPKVSYSLRGSALPISAAPQADSVTEWIIRHRVLKSLGLQWSFFSKYITILLSA